MQESIERDTQVLFDMIPDGLDIDYQDLFECSNYEDFQFHNAETDITAKHSLRNSQAKFRKNFEESQFNHEKLIEEGKQAEMEYIYNRRQTQNDRLGVSQIERISSQVIFDFFQWHHQRRYDPDLPFQINQQIYVPIYLQGQTMTIQDQNVEITGGEGQMMSVLMADEQNRFGFNLQSLMEYEQLLFQDAVSGNLDRVQKYLEYLVWFDRITDFHQRVWYEIFFDEVKKKIARLAITPTFQRAVMQLGGIISHDCIVSRAFNYQLFEQKQDVEDQEMTENVEKREIEEVNILAQQDSMIDARVKRCVDILIEEMQEDQETLNQSNPQALPSSMVYEIKSKNFISNLQADESANLTSTLQQLHSLFFKNACDSVAMMGKRTSNTLLDCSLEVLNDLVHVDQVYKALQLYPNQICDITLEFLKNSSPTTACLWWALNNIHCPLFYANTTQDQFFEMGHITLTGKELIYAGIMSIAAIRDITHSLLQGFCHRFNRSQDEGVKSQSHMGYSLQSAERVIRQSLVYSGLLNIDITDDNSLVYEIDQLHSMYSIPFCHSQTGYRTNSFIDALTNGQSNESDVYFNSIFKKMFNSLNIFMGKTQDVMQILRIDDEMVCQLKGCFSNGIMHALPLTMNATMSQIPSLIKQEMYCSTISNGFPILANLALISLSEEYANYGMNKPKGWKSRVWSQIRGGEKLGVYRGLNFLAQDYDINTLDIGQLLNLLGDNFTNLQHLTTQLGLDITNHERLKSLKGKFTIPSLTSTIEQILPGGIVDALNEPIEDFVGYQGGQRRMLDQSELASMLMAVALGNDLEQSNNELRIQLALFALGTMEKYDQKERERILKLESSVSTLKSIALKQQQNFDLDTLRMMPVDQTEQQRKAFVYERENERDVSKDLLKSVIDGFTNEDSQNPLSKFIKLPFDHVKHNEDQEFQNLSIKLGMGVQEWPVEGIEGVDISIAPLRTRAPNQIEKQLNSIKQNFENSIDFKKKVKEALKNSVEYHLQNDPTKLVTETSQSKFLSMMKKESNGILDVALKSLEQQASLPSQAKKFFLTLLDRTKQMKEIETQLEHVSEVFGSQKSLAQQMDDQTRYSNQYWQTANDLYTSLNDQPYPFPKIFESLSSTAMKGQVINDNDRRIPIKKWQKLSDTLFDRDFQILNSANITTDKMLGRSSKSMSCRYYLAGFFYGYQGQREKFIQLAQDVNRNYQHQKVLLNIGKQSLLMDTLQDTTKFKYENEMLQFITKDVVEDIPKYILSRIQESKHRHADMMAYEVSETQKKFINNQTFIDIGTVALTYSLMEVAKNAKEWVNDPVSKMKQKPNYYSQAGRTIIDYAQSQEYKAYQYLGIIPKGDRKTHQFEQNFLDFHEDKKTVNQMFNQGGQEWHSDIFTFVSRSLGVKEIASSAVGAFLRESGTNPYVISQRTEMLSDKSLMRGQSYEQESKTSTIYPLVHEFYGAFKINRRIPRLNTQTMREGLEAVQTMKINSIEKMIKVLAHDKSRDFTERLIGPAFLQLELRETTSKNNQLNWQTALAKPQPKKLLNIKYVSEDSVMEEPLIKSKIDAELNHLQNVDLPIAQSLLELLKSDRTDEQLIDEIYKPLPFTKQQLQYARDLQNSNTVIIPRFQSKVYSEDAKVDFIKQRVNNGLLGFVAYEQGLNTIDSIQKAASLNSQIQHVINAYDKGFKTNEQFLGGRSSFEDNMQIQPHNIAAYTEYSVDDAMWLLHLNKQSYMAYRYLEGQPISSNRQMRLQTDKIWVQDDKFLTSGTLAQIYFSNYYKRYYDQLTGPTDEETQKKQIYENLYNIFHGGQSDMQSDALQIVKLGFHINFNETSTANLLNPKTPAEKAILLSDELGLLNQNAEQVYNTVHSSKLDQTATDMTKQLGQSNAPLQGDSLLSRSIQGVYDLLGTGKGVEGRQAEQNLSFGESLPEEALKDRRNNVLFDSEAGMNPTYRISPNGTVHPSVNNVLTQISQARALSVQMQNHIQSFQSQFEKTPNPQLMSQIREKYANRMNYLPEYGSLNYLIVGVMGFLTTKYILKSSSEQCRKRREIDKQLEDMAEEFAYREELKTQHQYLPENTEKQINNTASYLSEAVESRMNENILTFEQKALNFKVINEANALNNELRHSAGSQLVGVTSVLTQAATNYGLGRQLDRLPKNLEQMLGQMLSLVENNVRENNKYRYDKNTQLQATKIGISNLAHLQKEQISLFNQYGALAKFSAKVFENAFGDQQTSLFDPGTWLRAAARSSETYSKHFQPIIESNVASFAFNNRRVEHENGYVTYEHGGNQLDIFRFISDIHQKYTGQPRRHAYGFEHYRNDYGRPSGQGKYLGWKTLNEIRAEEAEEKRQQALALAEEKKNQEVAQQAVVNQQNDQPVLKGKKAKKAKKAKKGKKGGDGGPQPDPSSSEPDSDDSGPDPDVPAGKKIKDMDFNEFLVYSNKVKEARKKRKDMDLKPLNNIENLTREQANAERVRLYEMKKKGTQETYTPQDTIDMVQERRLKYEKIQDKKKLKLISEKLAAEQKIYDEVKEVLEAQKKEKEEEDRKVLEAKRKEAREKAEEEYRQKLEEYEAYSLFGKVASLTFDAVGGAAQSLGNFSLKTAELMWTEAALREGTNAKFIVDSSISLASLFIEKTENFIAETALYEGEPGWETNISSRQVDIENKIFLKKQREEERKKYQLEREAKMAYWSEFEQSQRELQKVKTEIKARELKRQVDLELQQKEVDRQAAKDRYLGLKFAELANIKTREKLIRDQSIVQQIIEDSQKQSYDNIYRPIQAMVTDSEVGAYRELYDIPQTRNPYFVPEVPPIPPIIFPQLEEQINTFEENHPRYEQPKKPPALSISIEKWKDLAEQAIKFQQDLVKPASMYEELMNQKKGLPKTKLQYDFERNRSVKYSDFFRNMQNKRQKINEIGEFEAPTFEQLFNAGKYLPNADSDYKDLPNTLFDVPDEYYQNRSVKREDGLLATLNAMIQETVDKYAKERADRIKKTKADVQFRLAEEKLEEERRIAKERSKAYTAEVIRLAEEKEKERLAELERKREQEESYKKYKEAAKPESKLDQMFREYEYLNFPPEKEVIPEVIPVRTYIDEHGNFVYIDDPFQIETPIQQFAGFKLATGSTDWVNHFKKMKEKAVANRLAQQSVQSQLIKDEVEDVVKAAKEVVNSMPDLPTSEQNASQLKMRERKAAEKKLLGEKVQRERIEKKLQRTTDILDEVLSETVNYRVNLTEKSELEEFLYQQREAVEEPFIQLNVVEDQVPLKASIVEQNVQPPKQKTEIQNMIDELEGKVESKKRSIVKRIYIKRTSRLPAMMTQSGAEPDVQMEPIPINDYQDFSGEMQIFEFPKEEYMNPIPKGGVMNIEGWGNGVPQINEEEQIRKQVVESVNQQKNLKSENLVSMEELQEQRKKESELWNLWRVMQMYDRGNADSLLDHNPYKHPPVSYLEDLPKVYDPINPKKSIEQRRKEDAIELNQIAVLDKNGRQVKQRGKNVYLEQNLDLAMERFEARRAEGIIQDSYEEMNFEQKDPRYIKAFAVQEDNIRKSRQEPQIPKVIQIDTSFSNKDPYGYLTELDKAADQVLEKANQVSKAIKQSSSNFVSEKDKNLEILEKFNQTMNQQQLLQQKWDNSIDEHTGKRISLEHFLKAEGNGDFYSEVYAIGSVMRKFRNEGFMTEELLQRLNNKSNMVFYKINKKIEEKEKLKTEIEQMILNDQNVTIEVVAEQRDVDMNVEVAQPVEVEQPVEVVQIDEQEQQFQGFFRNWKEQPYQQSEIFDQSDMSFFVQPNGQINNGDVLSQLQTSIAEAVLLQGGVLNDDNFQDIVQEVNSLMGGIEVEGGWTESLKNDETIGKLSQAVADGDEQQIEELSEKLIEEIERSQPLEEEQVEDQPSQPSTNRYLQFDEDLGGLPPEKQKFGKQQFKPFTNDQARLNEVQAGSKFLVNKYIKAAGEIVDGFIEEIPLRHYAVDVGSGNGYLSKHVFSKKFNFVDALDLDQKSIDKIVKDKYATKNQMKYVFPIRTDIQQHKFPLNSYDLVWGQGVMGYIHNENDLVQVLKRMGSSLREISDKVGKIVLVENEPTEQELESARTQLGGQLFQESRVLYQDGQYIRTREHWGKVINKAGLELEKVVEKKWSEQKTKKVYQSLYYIITKKKNPNFKQDQDGIQLELGEDQDKTVSEGGIEDQVMEEAAKEVGKEEVPDQVMEEVAQEIVKEELTMAQKLLIERAKRMQNQKEEVKPEVKPEVKEGDEIRPVIEQTAIQKLLIERAKRMQNQKEEVKPEVKPEVKEGDEIRPVIEQTAIQKLLIERAKKIQNQKDEVKDEVKEEIKEEVGIKPVFEMSMTQKLLKDLADKTKISGDGMGSQNEENFKQTFEQMQKIELEMGMKKYQDLFNENMTEEQRKQAEDQIVADFIKEHGLNEKDAIYYINKSKDKSDSQLERSLQKYLSVINQKVSGDNLLKNLLDDNYGEFEKDLAKIRIRKQDVDIVKTLLRMKDFFEGTRQVVEQRLSETGYNLSTEDVRAIMFTFRQNKNSFLKFVAREVERPDFPKIQNDESPFYGKQGKQEFQAQFYSSVFGYNPNDEKEEEVAQEEEEIANPLIGQRDMRKQPNLKQQLQGIKKNERQRNKVSEGLSDLIAAQTPLMTEILSNKDANFKDKSKKNQLALAQKALLKEMMQYSGNRLQRAVKDRSMFNRYLSAEKAIQQVNDGTMLQKAFKKSPMNLFGKYAPYVDQMHIGLDIDNVNDNENAGNYIRDTFIDLRETVQKPEEKQRKIKIAIDRWDAEEAVELEEFRKDKIKSIELLVKSRITDAPPENWPTRDKTDYYKQVTQLNDAIDATHQAALESITLKEQITVQRHTDRLNALIQRMDVQNQRKPLAGQQWVGIDKYHQIMSKKLSDCTEYERTQILQVLIDLGVSIFDKQQFEVNMKKSDIQLGTLFGQYEDMGFTEEVIWENDLKPKTIMKEAYQNHPGRKIGIMNELSFAKIEQNEDYSNIVQNELNKYHLFFQFGKMKQLSSEFKENYSTMELIDQIMEAKRFAHRQAIRVLSGEKIKLEPAAGIALIPRFNFPAFSEESVETEAFVVQIKAMKAWVYEAKLKAKQKMDAKRDRMSMYLPQYLYKPTEQMSNNEKSCFQQLLTELGDNGKIENEFKGESAHKIIGNLVERNIQAPDLEINFFKSEYGAFVEYKNAYFGRQLRTFENKLKNYERIGREVHDLKQAQKFLEWGEQVKQGYTLSERSEFDRVVMSQYAEQFGQRKHMNLIESMKEGENYESFSDSVMSKFDPSEDFQMDQQVFQENEDLNESGLIHKFKKGYNQKEYDKFVADVTGIENRDLHRQVVMNLASSVGKLEVNTKKLQRLKGRMKRRFKVLKSKNKMLVRFYGGDFKNFIYKEEKSKEEKELVEKEQRRAMEYIQYLMGFNKTKSNMEDSDN